MMRFAVSRVLLLLVLVALCCAKKDRNSPHRNTGLLKSYEPGPFDLTLNPDDEKMLAAGKPVMKQTMPSDDDAGGGAICIQDIDAPKEAVWNQILRMNDYMGKVSKVKECKNYQVTQHDDGTFTIKTKQVLGVMPGYAYENYYNHKYTPDKDSVTWKLDYDKTSDFDDVSGHWHLENHPKKPGCTRVFYSCDIALRTSPPGPILNYISKSALKQATSWVKKESESEPTNAIPDEFRGPTGGAAPVEEQPKAFSGFGIRR